MATPEQRPDQVADASAVPAKKKQMRRAPSHRTQGITDCALFIALVCTTCVAVMFVVYSLVVDAVLTAQESAFATTARVDAADANAFLNATLNEAYEAATFAGILLHEYDDQFFVEEEGVAWEVGVWTTASVLAQALRYYKAVSALTAVAADGTVVTLRHSPGASKHPLLGDFALLVADAGDPHAPSFFAGVFNETHAHLTALVAAGGPSSSTTTTTTAADNRERRRLAGGAKAAGAVSATATAATHTDDSDSTMPAATAAAPTTARRTTPPAAMTAASWTNSTPKADRTTLVRVTQVYFDSSSNSSDGGSGSNSSTLSTTTTGAIASDDVAWTTASEEHHGNIASTDSGSADSTATTSLVTGRTALPFFATERDGFNATAGNTTDYADESTMTTTTTTTTTSDTTTSDSVTRDVAWTTAPAILTTRRKLTTATTATTTAPTATAAPSSTTTPTTTASPKSTAGTFAPVTPGQDAFAVWLSEPLPTSSSSPPPPSSSPSPPPSSASDLLTFGQSWRLAASPLLATNAHHSPVVSYSVLVATNCVEHCDAGSIAEAAAAAGSSNSGSRRRRTSSSSDGAEKMSSRPVAVAADIDQSLLQAKLDMWANTYSAFNGLPVDFHFVLGGSISGGGSGSSSDGNKSDSAVVVARVDALGAATARDVSWQHMEALDGATDVAVCGESSSGGGGGGGNGNISSDGGDGGSDGSMPTAEVDGAWPVSLGFIDVAKNSSGGRWGALRLQPDAVDANYYALSTSSAARLTQPRVYSRLARDDIEEEEGEEEDDDGNDDSDGAATAAPAEQQHAYDDWYELPCYDPRSTVRLAMSAASVYGAQNAGFTGRPVLVVSILLELGAVGLVIASAAVFATADKERRNSEARVVVVVVVAT
jgi:hypothetical protein